MPALDPNDNYAICETGVMLLLRQLTLFSTDPSHQVSDNRFNVNRGADYWAVFTPGTFSSTRLDAHNYRYVWAVIFDLYVRYKTAEESLGRFKSARNMIDNWLGVNPTLAGARGVESIVLSAKSEVLQDVPGDNPNFIIQTLTASVAQRVVRKF